MCVCVDTITNRSFLLDFMTAIMDYILDESIFIRNFFSGIKFKMATIWPGLPGEMLKGFSYFSREQNDQQNFCTIDWSRD